MTKRDARNRGPQDETGQAAADSDSVVVSDTDRLGPDSSHFKMLADLLGFRFGQRGSLFFFPDKDPDLLRLGKKALSALLTMPVRGSKPTPWEVECLGALLSGDPDIDLDSFFREENQRSDGSPRKVIARTLAQKEYMNSMRSNHLTFGLGPAGTGKTYLAVAMAVEALLRGDVNRIVLTRPAVEAGERLGFLPGDLADKVDPYLRPLFDALYELWPGEGRFGKKSRGQGKFQGDPEISGNLRIEVAPLAFMRGRTLSRSFVILDEAQNASPEQLKMFLTRIGVGTKAVVTADPSQSDLPGGEPSGLIDAEKILSGIKGISFCYFTKRDSVRHHLVREIVAAYERHHPAKLGKDPESPPGPRAASDAPGKPAPEPPAPEGGKKPKKKSEARKTTSEARKTTSKTRKTDSEAGKTGPEAKKVTAAGAKNPSAKAAKSPGKKTPKSPAAAPETAAEDGKPERTPGP
jgi:phosphate starvation-inducible PhoH-like protein